MILSAGAFLTPGVVTKRIRDEAFGVRQKSRRFRCKGGSLAAALQTKAMKQGWLFYVLNLFGN
jgi:hypothetical protein